MNIKKKESKKCKNRKNSIMHFIARYWLLFLLIILLLGLILIVVLKIIAINSAPRYFIYPIFG